MTPTETDEQSTLAELGNPEPLVFRFSRACSRFVNLQISNYATVQRKRTEDALCFDCFIHQSCHDIHSHRWPTSQWMHRVNHCHKFIIWYNIDAKVGRPCATGENDSCLLNNVCSHAVETSYNCLFKDANLKKCNMLKHHKTSCGEYKVEMEMFLQGWSERKSRWHIYFLSFWLAGMCQLKLLVGQLIGLSQR